MIPVLVHECCACPFAQRSPDDGSYHCSMRLYTDSQRIHPAMLGISSATKPIADPSGPVPQWCPLRISPAMIVMVTT